MMMILGMFVFSLPTLAYQELQRKTQWKYASNGRIGRRDAKQFTGPGDDTITLSGWVAPELTGSLYSFDALRLMADTGKSWILIQGTGRIYGAYVITDLAETRTVLDGSGDAAKVEFSITLERSDDNVPALIGLGDISELRNMLRLDSLTNSIADGARNAIGSVVGGITDKVGGVVDAIKGPFGGSST